MVSSPIVRLAAPFAAKTLGFRDVLPSPLRADIDEIPEVGTGAAKGGTGNATLGTLGWALARDQGYRCPVWLMLKLGT